MDHRPMFCMDARFIPDEERTAVIRFEDFVRDLQRYAYQFDCALALYDYSIEYRATVRAHMAKDESFRPDERQDNWPLIAARDGAITLYNFKQTLDNITTSLFRCPSIRDLPSEGLFRQIKKRFSEQLPSIKQIRHGVAHAADFAGQPQKHAFTKGFYEGSGVSLQAQSIVIHDQLVNRVYTTTVERDVISYEISQGTLDFLNAIDQEIRLHLAESFQKLGKP